jgi:hypothetical protein
MLSKIRNTALVTLGCYIPLWIYLFLRFIFNPEGFWQNFVLFGVGLYIFGGLQIILIVVWLLFLVAIWEK